MNYRSTCLVAAALGLTLAGCSDDLYEETTGSVDLVPFFPGSAADPTSGLPRQINPTRGWVNGQRVEYYDFGTVTLPRKTGTRGEALRAPDAASVNPMYFFYDQQGRPLFAEPAFDPRANTWIMPGGKGALDPAPVQSTGDAYYQLPYTGRPRAALIDPDRGVADYQRPIIDVLMGEAGYSGLWEIVEVTVKDSTYTVDDVKSGTRLEEALADGKVSERRTGFVINCPLVDERTAVTPSAMNNNVPRPRIELWYRTKLGNCFLANGWESLGKTLNQDVSAGDRSNLQLFKANENPAERINTLDVIAAPIGSETSITAPVAKMFTPASAVPQNTPNLDRPRTRFPNDDVFTALPRRTAADPGGYSPITWLWDINVPQDPPYVPGSLRNANDLMVPPDPFPPANPTLGGTVEARDGGTTVVSRNIAVIGPATKCKADADCKFGQQCNPMPDTSLATTDPPAGQNIADVVIQREGGARCDVPVGGFGAYCSPGVSRCDVQTPAGSANETQLKAIGVATAGPTFTVHADMKAAQTKLDEAKASTDQAVLDTVPALEMALARATTRAAYYDELGFTTDLNGWGYLCYPGATGTGFGSGFCQIRCDSGASGTVVEVKSQIKPAGGTPVDYTFRTEARCGGTNMLGYRCLPSGTVPERQRVCVRECNRQANTAAAYYVDDPAPTAAFNAALCSHPFNIKGTDMMGTPIQPSGDLPPMTQIDGQECLSASLSVAGAGATTVRACTWNPDMVPRNPNIWPGQP